MSSRRLSYILQQQVHLYTPAGQRAAAADRHLRRRRAPDRGRDGPAAAPRLKPGRRHQLRQTRKALRSGGPFRDGAATGPPAPDSPPGDYLPGSAGRAHEQAGTPGHPRTHPPTRPIAWSRATITPTSSRAAPLDFFVGHLVDQPGQARHLGQSEGDAVLGQLAEAPAVVETAAGDDAHLVVQLGPAHPAAAVAEPDEIEGGVRGCAITRCACANPWMHSLLFDSPTESGTCTTTAGIDPGWAVGPPRVSPPRQACVAC